MQTEPVQELPQLWQKLFLQQKCLWQGFVPMNCTYKWKEVEFFHNQNAGVECEMTTLY